MAAKKHRLKRITAKYKQVFSFVHCGLVVLLLWAGWAIWHTDAVQMRFVYMWPYQQTIVEYSERNQVDPFLIAAIIKNESNFQQQAVSEVGAIGLMQIMPVTGAWIAQEMGMEDYQEEYLYRTKTNIRMGCWYLGELQYEFRNNPTLMITAYNAGRGQTRHWMEEYGWDYSFQDVEAIPFADTREYVSRVLQDRNNYYRLYCNEIKRVDR